MYSAAIDDLVTELQTITEFSHTEDVPTVMRGEYGKLNVIKSKGCLVMPDFKNVPVNFPVGDGPIPKQLAFIANCFVITAQHKTLVGAEDDVMLLADKVVQKIEVKEFLFDMNDNKKYGKWEWTDIEWLDRSASLCVIALEFSINLQS